MQYTRETKLADLVDTADPRAVVEEVYRLYSTHYDSQNFLQIAGVAERIRAMFSGGFRGYHACDTGYHDLRHTMDVFLANMRILDGKSLGTRPIPEDLARDLLIASLCHDVGYIRKVGEEEGTGARFTALHVRRSADFVRSFGDTLGLDTFSIERVARIIMATGLKREFEEQPWQSEPERETGAILASADLIGQMSDRAYLEKLLFLYYEFREACIPGYDTEFDILRKTIGFYEMTISLLDGKLLGVRAWVREHFKKRFGMDRDLYAEAIVRQMDYLREILADDSTNFRKKLKRLDLETITEGHHAV